MKKEPFGTRLIDLRFSNTSGKVIPMHHAFLTLRMHSIGRVTAIVTPLFFLGLVWLFLPMLAGGWGHIFEFWMQGIYGGHAGSQPLRILGRVINLPYPMLEAAVPSFEAVYWNLLACAVLFLASFLMPQRITPVTYLARAALLIQASASIDRMVSPGDFPYTLPLYLTDALALSIYLVFLLPVILGFVYYIFDFGLWRKVLLTVIMLAYFFVAIPCQYMLHAMIIHAWTLLFLPLMYLLFGTLLNVLMFVSIYAVGMSWHSNVKAMQGRGL